MRRIAPFIAAAALLVAAIAANAQDKKLPRVGWLASGPAPGNPNERAFPEGLRDLGHVDGRTIILDVRWTGAMEARYSALTAELIGLKPDVLVSGGARCEIIAALTQTIPIVCANLFDPVARGVVGSFARPGSNVTGTLMLTAELFHKRFQLVKEAIPTAVRVGVLWLPENEWLLRETAVAARLIGLEIEPRRIDAAADLDAAFEAFARSGVAAVVTTQGPFFTGNRRKIVELARHHRLPTLSGDTGFAAAGGFADFGPDISANWRRAATYVDKILKGAKPADLPIEQPAPRFVVNLKTAEALGITFPPAILFRADEVIE